MKRMASMKMVMELQMKEPMVLITTQTHSLTKTMNKRQDRLMRIRSEALKFAFASTNQKVGRCGRGPCGIRLCPTKTVDEICVWKRHSMVI